MRRALAVVFPVVLMFLLGASPAVAANNDVKILSSSKVDPDPVTITVGDTVTWSNEDKFPHDIWLGGKKLNSTPILPGDSFSTRIDVVGTLDYGLDSSADSSHKIVSRPKPTTTTAPPTTAAPTTTTTTTTTTTPTTTTTAAASSAKQSSSSSSTSSSTTLVAAPAAPKSGGSGAAPLLAAAAVVVAALAGVTFWAWRRSGQIPYAPGGASTNGAPPTASQPPV